MIEQPARPTRQGNQWWVSAMLVLAGILIPVAILCSWVHFLILDEHRFVRTVTPVIDAPAVQHSLTESLVDGVRRAIERTSATNTTLEGLVATAGGIEAVLAELRPSIERLLGSGEFMVVWSDANRLAHGGLIRLLSNRPGDVTGYEDELTLAFANLSSDLGISPDSRVGRVLAELPGELSPRISVLHQVEVPAARVVIDNARWIDLVASALAAGLVVIGLWFGRNRRHSLMLIGAIALLSLPIALLVRTLLREAFGDVPAPYDTLANEYAGVLTAPLETGFLLVAAIGLTVTFLSWMWPRFSRPIPPEPNA